MNEMVVGVLALALGWVLGALVQERRARVRREGVRHELDEARQELGQVRARFEAWREAAEQQRATDEQTAKRMEDAFGSLSVEALARNSELFLKQASERFEDRSLAIERMLAPFQAQLKELEKHARELEAKREQAYGSLTSQVKGLAEAAESLRSSSEGLSVALRGSSSARGRWGETTLRNIVELSGMVEHCDFVEQTTTSEGLRPDLVVRMPGGDGIPVDAKVSLAAYMEGLETEDPAEQLRCARRHADAVRNHMRTLARRDYAGEVDGQVDFTVMFLPGDHFLAEAFRHHPDLFEEGSRERVLIATPVTLLALLRTVGVYWRQESMAANARQVWEAASEFHKRVETFVGHLGRVRKGLGSAVESFNSAVGSFERMVLPAGRRLETLGAADRSKGPLQAVDPVELAPRTLLEGEADPL